MDTWLIYMGMLGLLALGGLALVYVAFARARFIDRTDSMFVPAKISVLDVNLVPLNVDGVTAGGAPLTDKTAMVIVRYEYSMEGVTYQSRAVFPLDIEWLKPRVPPLRLFENLKGGSIHTCFVDAGRPAVAVLFKGWSPYLRSHVRGVAAGGFLTTAIALALVVAIAQS
jgi:hypothetical protein